MEPRLQLREQASRIGFVVASLYIVLTLRASIRGRSLNRRPLPALDGIKNTLFFLTLRGEAGYLLARDYRFAG